MCRRSAIVQERKALKLNGRNESAVEKIVTEMSVAAVVVCSGSRGHLVAKPLPPK